VELRLGSAERLPDLGTRFDKVFAVNVHMFWSDPMAVLRGLRGVLKAGGTIALTFQPRRRGATGADTRRTAERIANALRNAGFESVRIEILDMAPVEAACVLGRVPG
jgi:SAM-dependent methyltransferase